ncbi:MAG: phosphocholine cytidylyltransferase family protein [Alphaproteobacteria bacterium]|jgi:L-glutamine-phosphate cytidylyltransferase|nr:phosphocholine cytidylyltransferase family protein [Alphaproteobacteria bacterium]
MRAIILAAGRGSRLKGMTDAQPKCLVELAGQPLLHWQIAALRDAGIDEIALVTGYKSEVLEAKGLPTRHNEDWQNTQMVASMLCARDLMDGPVIVSYSDIVYSADAVRTLMDTPADLGIAFDRDWARQWQERFEDPLSDAESFRTDGAGRLIEIGARVASMAEPEGQFMGLMKFSPASLGWVDGIMGSDEDLKRNMDMTAMCSRLISAGKSLTAVDVTGWWCEVDDQNDLKVAEAMVADGRLVPPGDSPS